MNNFFKALSKPAKWILVIGSLVYATWFAVQTAGSIQGTFMSVASNLIILVVGSVLLFSVPILILVKKVDMAKIAFLILAGYWLISTTRSMFNYAETYCVEGAPGAAIAGGIFAVYISWISSGLKETPEEIAKIALNYTLIKNDK